HVSLLQSIVILLPTLPSYDHSSSIYCYVNPRDLHSFPTRRSSDLWNDSRPHYQFFIVICKRYSIEVSFTYTKTELAISTSHILSLHSGMLYVLHPIRFYH